MTAIGLLVHEIAVGPAWEVNEVEVTGNVRASEAALRHLADIRHGTHLARVDLDRAVANVQTHPWVRSVETRRVFPSGVQLVIEEHQPTMLLALDDLWYVDTRGDVFRRADSDDLDYPILTGMDPKLAVDHPQVAQAVMQHALTILDAGQGHPHVSPAHVSEVRFHASSGFTLVLRNGTELMLGFAPAGERLDRLDRLVMSGLDPSDPQRVDLGGDRVAVATPLPDPVHQSL